MAKVTRDKTMGVPAEALAKAILDFENYPKFIGEVVSAERLPGGTAEKQRVKFELEIMKRFQYVLEFAIRGHEEIAWRLVESNFFKTNQGHWRLRPEGAGVHVEYEVEVAFPFFVPGWIVKKLTEVNLPKMFESFEGRAEDIAKGKS